MCLFKKKEQSSEKIEAVGLTDIGRKRRINQDYIFVSIDAVGALPNLFVLADGMGGHSAGDTASSMLTESIRDVVSKTIEKEPVRIFETAVALSNRKIYKKSLSSAAYAGMGTTLVAASIDGATLYCVNVGDSRAYIISEGKIRQITRDHSLVEEMVRAGVLERGSEDYLRQKNVLTRAVGIDPDVDADYYDEALSDGDFVLLASDGLTNMIPDEEILKLILNAGDIQVAAQSLIDTANKNGGNDNIAVILIRYRKGDEADD